MSNIFSVDLFYGNIGFTDDYSNVLQFPTKSARDEYFDNLEHISVQNTNVNRINISGNSIKFAFTNEQDIENLEKFNYIRINTTLFGTGQNVGLPVLKREYGFINDFEVISSSENVTVVSFTFSVDIWQNYQFDFELKECNVIRSHMDRWNPDGTIKYTRPSQDMLESMVKVYKDIPIKNKYRITSTSGTVTTDIALVVITYITTIRGVDALSMLYYIVDLQRIDSRARCFSGYSPSLSQTLSGNVATILGIANENVKNINIILNPNIKVEIVNGSTRIKRLDGTQQNYISIANIFAETQYYAYTFVADGNYILAYNVPWSVNNKIGINVSMPIKPTNNVSYSTAHEIMLYKSPVIKRYIINYDGTAKCEIPDILIKRENNFISVMNQVDYETSYTMIAFNEDVNVIDVYKSNLLSSLLVITNPICTIINDMWNNYYLTTRESDRNMMMVNILSGGLADAGSTAISAGIGYRSNMERAVLSEIKTQDMATQGNEVAGMYSRYAKQAARFSIAGGVLQFGANAYSSYMSQVNKENAIKNTPAPISKSGNGFSLTLSNVSMCNYVELICDDSSYEQYANIFKRYGYAINGVIVPNIMSRKYFNYIRTNGAILTGSANQSILTNLALLFDRGMTIWHMDYTTRETLYTYDKENIERSLM